MKKGDCDVAFAWYCLQLGSCFCSRQRLLQQFYALRVKRDLEAVAERIGFSGRGKKAFADDYMIILDQFAQDGVLPELSDRRTLHQALKRLLQEAR